jgi:hypothetical protein
VVGGAAHYGTKKANQAAASQEQAQQAAYEQGLAAAQQQAPAAPAPAAPAEDDPMAEVQKLAEMHAAGILTDDEFAAAKAKALGI